MECRGSLIYAHLVAPGLDPDEVSRGWLSVVCATLVLLLASYGLT